mmetsp:Transcript_7437/g.20278  ORF Transcript_7437/g.20278 Transcript_7437/m.20278 type:complete len:362 (-) Transcript_7437:468-1553(-)
MPHYSSNYGEAEALKTPSIMPHVTRVVSFNRTPMEAWHEYQEELSRVINERHATRIQAHARGRRDRQNTLRMKLQQENIVIIQKLWRAKLARTQLERYRKQYQVIILFASAERKAVMRLQHAFRMRRQRRQEAAAQFMQAAWVGRKTRLETREELLKRRTAYFLATAQTEAAFRIQYAWYRFRVAMLEKQNVQQDKVVMEQVADEERARAMVERRDKFIMAKPVYKKARRLPLLGFWRQKKQMQVVEENVTQDNKVCYWKFSEASKERVKEIPLAQVQAIEQREGKGHVLVLTLQGGAGVRGGPLQLKYADEEAAQVWLKHFKNLCPHARVTLADSSRQAASSAGGANAGGGLTRPPPPDP